MSGTTLWLGVLACAAGCYAFKILGLSLPEHFLERPIVRRLSALMPVALLAALVAVGTFAEGKELVIDARAAGLAAAVIALVLRAPFLLVVFLAAATAALVRLVS